MSDVLTVLATTLARQGAPVIGGLIGTAIGGPAGAAIGGMAGKVIETLAQELGTEPTPAAVLDKVKQPDARAVVQDVEARAPDLMPVWSAQIAMAQQAQTAELEKGFSSWNWRRNFAHYTTWGLTGLGGAAALAAAFLGNPQAASIAAIFGTCVSLTMAWLAVNSGGKALTDFAREWGARK